MRAMEERAGQLAAIEGGLDRAATGSGTVLYVEGPAGIGKSRLLQAAAQMANRRGPIVLSASGRAAEQELGYGVAVQLFEPPWLALDAAAQAQLRDGPAGPAARLISGGDPGGGQELTIIRGLLRLVGELAAQGPGLMLLVDDGRWADAPSLRFLSYLAARLRELPIVLIVAARPAVSGSAEGVLAAVRASADLVLRPSSLTADAAARIIGDVFPGADPELSDAFVRLTGGNPLLLEGLLAEARIQGGTPSVSAIEGLVPAAAVTLVGDELRDLGASARALARAVSVLKTPASVVQAAGVAGLHAEEAARAADALAEVQLLEAGEPLRFRCELLRSAVRTSIPETQRAMALRGDTSVREPARIETVSPAQAVRSLVTSDALEQALVLLETPDLQPGRSSDPQTEAALGAWRAWSRYYQGAIADALSAVQATADVLSAAGGSASGLAGVIAACRLQLGELERADQALRVLQTSEELAPNERPILLDIRAQLRLAQKQPREALIDALEAGRQARVADVDADPGLGQLALDSRLGPARAWRARRRPPARRGGVGARPWRGPAPGHGQMPAGAGPGRRRATPPRPAGGRSGARSRRAGPAGVPARARRSGGVHRRANRRAAALEPLTDALELCRERGATALALRAKAEIAAARNGRRSETRHSGAQTLTPSERRVATLAARGQTTRQIAGELFVSPKTVEFHLRHIYRKLEISSNRAELARAFGGRGVAGADGSGPSSRLTDVEQRGTRSSTVNPAPDRLTMRRRSTC